MNVRIEKSKDLKELAYFLAEMNGQKKSHIGFCGEHPKDIQKSLQEDFTSDDDVTFYEARNSDGKIVAAMGLDIDDVSAEVWGPVNQTKTIYVQNKLWKKLLNTYPTVKNFTFFINKENKRQQTFMSDIGAKNTGEHLDLTIEKKDFDMVSEI